eukprot:13224736-Alexandrium_andersonii.AAC.1
MGTAGGIPSKPPPPALGTYSRPPAPSPPAKASSTLGSMQQGPGTGDLRLVEQALLGLAKAPPQ